MKKFIFSLFLLAALTTVAAAQSSPTAPPGPLKVGYTNIEIVLSYMPDAIAVEKQLMEWVKKKQQQIEIKYSYLESLGREYQEKDQAGTWNSPTEKADLEKKITDLQKEIQLTENGAEEELAERRATLLSPVQKRMQDAIDAVAKEGGFTYILNQTVGGGIPSILYGVDQFDVTDLIAAKLGITIPRNDAPQN